MGCQHHSLCRVSWLTELIICVSAKKKIKQNHSDGGLSVVVLNPVSIACVTPLGRKLEVQHVNECPSWIGGFINPSLFLLCSETAPALILTAAVDHQQPDGDVKELQ